MLFMDIKTHKMYLHIIMGRQNHIAEVVAKPLLSLPCACQSLRRLTRMVTRIYGQELRKANIDFGCASRC